MSLKRKTADAIALNYLVSTKDEEVWRTTENGKHYQIETGTGEITKGMGGKLTGQKVDPSKKKSATPQKTDVPTPVKAEPAPAPKAETTPAGKQEHKFPTTPQEREKAKNDIYNTVHSNLNKMFYHLPQIETNSDSITFRLDGEDAKAVTARTMNRWMKELPFGTKCIREPVVGWHGPTGVYEYTVQLPKEDPNPKPAAGAIPTREEIHKMSASKKAQMLKELPDGTYADVWYKYGSNNQYSTRSIFQKKGDKWVDDRGTTLTTSQIAKSGNGKSEQSGLEQIYARNDENEKKYGRVEEIYSDGTVAYVAEGVELTPEEQKENATLMDSVIKADIYDQLGKKGLRRSDIDIDIDRDTGNISVKTWVTDPKTPNGLKNQYFDVKLTGQRRTNVKPDGTVDWSRSSIKGAKLIFRGEEIY